MNKDRLNLYVIFLVGGLFLLNLLQATCMDLSHDEAYYWIYSLFPAWGYYDHPPMVSWLIWGGTLFGKHETLVRLPFALMQAASLWLLWDLGQRKSFGVFATSILCMPLILASGFLALPDTPLMFFSILFWWLTFKYEQDERNWHVIALSLSIAGMFYSKYHSLVVVLLTVAALPKLLRRKSFWLIVLCVTALYLPHILWQVDNDFITFDFHLNKRSEKHFELSNILDFVGGQVALGGILAFIYGLYSVVKAKAKNKLLTYNSIGFFIFVLLLSFRNRIEANWTVTAFSALVPLLCLVLIQERTKKIFMILALPALLLMFGVRIALLLDYPLGKAPIKRLGEVKNWKEKTKLIVDASKGARIVADTYQVASKLSFYTDMLVPSLALGSRASQFLLLNLEKTIGKDEVVSYISDTNFPGSIKVEVGYEGPLYVLPLITFGELLNRYNISYEEVVRD